MTPIGAEAPPLHHLSDWTGWMWAITLLGAPLLFLVAGIALVIFGEAEEYFVEWGSAIQRMIAFAVLAIAAAIGGLLVAGSVARHIANATPDRLWLLFPLVVAGGYWFLATAAPQARRWLGWTIASGVAVGGIGIAINDSLNRIAADIPMGLKTLVTLLVVGIIGAIVYVAGSTRQQSW